MTRRLLLALAALLAGGCPSIDFDNGLFACHAPSDCRADEVCQAEHCVRSGAAGDAGLVNECEDPAQCGVGESCVSGSAGNRCLKTCASIADCSGADCKLFYNLRTGGYVAACSTSGGGSDLTACASPSDCIATYTCSHAGVCRQICTAVDTTCDVGSQTCVTVSPTWGLCAPP